MRRTNNRSHCPVNFALEAFGDSWSLLIVRDIVFYGKRTYGEFLQSDEHISTNILAARLRDLQAKGILVRSPGVPHARQEIFSLTDKGLDLIPVLLEMCGWSAAHDRLTTAPQAFVSQTHAHRDEMFRLVRRTVARGGSLFAGEDSVVRQLQQAATKKSYGQ